MSNDMVWVAVVVAFVVAAVAIDRYERAVERRQRRYADDDAQRRLRAELDRQEDEL